MPPVGKNQGPLAALAAIKAKQIPAVPTPVKPKASGEGSDFDTWYNNLNTTTTTSTIPSSTPTTVPPIITPKGKSDKPLSVQLDIDISDSVDRLQRAGYKPYEIKTVQETGKTPKSSGILPFLGRVAGLGLEWTLLKPIESLSVPRRFITSAVKESAQAARSAFIEPPQRYKATDYIPTHKQTGLPIAKPGDLVITNWEQVINTPIPKIEKLSPQEWQAAQDKVVKENKLTQSGSFKEFGREYEDPQMGVGKVIGNATGSSAVNRTIGFIGDTLLDPLTYATFGTGTPIKAALTPIVETLGKEAVIVLTEQAAKEVIEIGVKKATQNAALKIAEGLGTKVAAKEVQVAAKALVVDAAQLAAEQATTTAAKATAEQAAKQAISRYSAAGARRTIGASTKQSLAATLQSIKDEALQEAAEFAGTARGRVAQNLADSITDEVISNVATKGYTALTPIAEELGIKGGIRFGVPGARISVPGSEYITAPIGKLTSRARQGIYRIPFPGASGGVLGSLVTGMGGKGALEPGVEFGLKVGLNAGSLSTQEAVNAVRTLAEDKAFQALASSAKAPIKALTKNLADEAYKPYYKTVMDIVENAPVAKETVAEATARVGRPIADKELEFAHKVLDILNEFKGVIDNFRMSGDPGSRLVTVSETPARWFPQTLTDKAARWLGSKTPEAKVILDALGLETPPLPGQYLGNELKQGSRWFNGEILNGAETIAQLNRAARDFGLNFDFFDTNVFTALSKYADKFSKDYAFLKLIDSYATGVKAVSRPSFVSETATGFGYKTSAETAALADRLSSVLPDWAVKDITASRRVLEQLGEKTGKSALSTQTRKSIDEAIKEVDGIFDVMLNAARKGDSVADAWFSIGTDLQEQYAELFARSPQEVEKFIKTLDPRVLKTMVNLAEDSYVALNKTISPNTWVRADIAEMYTNILRLKNAKEANAFIRFVQDTNRFIKTWYLSSPGYHVRNGWSDGFQMLVAGGKPNYLNEGRLIADKWNKFISEYGDELIKEAASTGEQPLLPELGDMIDIFFNKYNIPKNLQYATKTAIENEGLIGTGITRETIGASAPGTVGVLGKEVPVREGLVGGTKSKLSRGLGVVPELSNKFGGTWEQVRRFMLTFDGIRQGLTPTESAARTSKFLVDYADLNQLDSVFGTVIPFWTWTSRNLPAQIQNMFYNPGIYEAYNNFRNNYTDKSGRNFLIPSWMEKSGAFVPGTLGGYPIAIKPELGFPGAGAPSPISDIAAGGLEGLASAVTPYLRAPIEAFLMNETTTGRKLETLPEQLGYVGGQYLPPLSPLGRTLNIPFGGRDVPGIRAIPGVKKESETPANVTNINALLSYLGIPVTAITPDVQNIKRYEILDAIDRMIKAKGK